MQTVFDLLGVLLGLVVLSMGLLAVYAVRFVNRRAVRSLPDDAEVGDLWAAHGVEFLPEGHRSLRAAAARIDEGSVDVGHELHGLPAPSGVRLCGRASKGGRDWYVADFWNVNSVTRSGSRTTSASVQVRAVASLELDRPAPDVIVARENALTLLVDAAGLGDVKLEGASFNRAFRIRAERSEDAYAILTPQVMEALELGGDRFALEVSGRLLTLTEVSGLRGRPAEGQRESLSTIARMMEGIAAGTREHTWPPRRGPSPDEWRGDDVVVDGRPPGAEHPTPTSTGKVADAVVTTIGLAFAAVGVVLVVTNTLSLVGPG